MRKNAVGGSRVHQEAKTRSRVQEVDEIAAGGQVAYNPPAAGAFPGRRLFQEQGSVAGSHAPLAMVEAERTPLAARQLGGTGGHR